MVLLSIFFCMLVLGFLGMMWCMGWVFAKARICLRVTLSHLKLVPDVLEGDLGPPQPKSSHFGGLFKVLACFFPYRSLGEFQLRKCEKKLFTYRAANILLFV